MKPLDGIRVIDVTTNISGPTLTMILADLGAEVIKVEKPIIGDEARKMEPKKHEDGVYFLNINRQKKSIVLNLKEETDKETMLELIKTADVFVENYRAGVAQKIGLDYETCKQINNQLIYCTLSAYGQFGPKAKFPGYDAIIQAETGLMSITGSDDLARVPVSLVDQGSAMWGVIGILSALFDRANKRQGCHVNTSLYETGIFWSNYHLLSAQFTGQNPQKIGSNHGAFSPYGAYRTKDMPVMIGISNNSLFERFCNVIGKEEWLQDPNFVTNDVRVKHRNVLNEKIEEITLTKSSDEWIEIFEGGGIPTAKVKTMLDVLEDKQLQDNNCIVSLSHPVEGEIYVTRIPITLSNCSLIPMRAAPLYGQHTEEILQHLISR